MEMEIISKEKNEIELKINNITIAEVLRTYLNNQGIEFAVWRREHPTKPIIFKIKSSGKTVQKAVSDAVSTIKKDLDKISMALKKK